MVVSWAWAPPGWCALRPSQRSRRRSTTGSVGWRSDPRAEDHASHRGGSPSWRGGARHCGSVRRPSFAPRPGVDSSRQGGTAGPSWLSRRRLGTCWALRWVTWVRGCGLPAGESPRRKDLLEGSWRDQVDEDEPQAEEPTVGIGSEVLEHALGGASIRALGVLAAPGPGDVGRALDRAQPGAEGVEGDIEGVRAVGLVPGRSAMPRLTCLDGPPAALV